DRLIAPYTNRILPPQDMPSLETVAVSVPCYDDGIFQAADRASGCAARDSWFRNQTRGVIGMEYRIIDETGIHHDVIAIEGHLEAIQASGSGTIQIFAVNVIVRPMTGTLEACAVIAERHRTAQVDAALVERDPV